ncbi:MAG TPA: hypothetical protein VF469_32425 [Kofleriaceae bacterium]
MWDWKEYIILATQLVPSSFTLPSDEARVRSVVSRAYYGAYHSAREYAIHNNLYALKGPRDRPKHGDVWQSFFQRQCSDDEKQAGRLGDALMADRHIADYEMNLRALSKVGHSAIQRAHEIRRLLGYPPLPPARVAPPP